MLQKDALTSHESFLIIHVVRWLVERNSRTMMFLPFWSPHGNAETTHRLLFLCEYKGHAKNELWQQLSPIWGFQNGDEIWQLDGGGLVITSSPRLVNVGAGGPLGAPKYGMMQNL